MTEWMKCHHCGKNVLDDHAVGCRCDKYGASDHEELTWCSEDCRDEDAIHNGPEPEPEEGWDYEQR